MATTFRLNHVIQLQSFWNLIQTTDEDVQRELYVLLDHKYNQKKTGKNPSRPSFLQMKGILKGNGYEKTDKQMMEEYLEEKYGI